MKAFVDRLFQEIKGENKSTRISRLERKISNVIEETINYKDFFNLPIFNILNIVEKADLTNVDDPIDFIKTFITNTVEKHSNERETLCLLFSFQTQDLNLEYQDIIKILQQFSNSQLCSQLGKLFDYQSGLPDVDIDYLIKEKDDQIQQLREKIELKENVTKQPIDYEPDICKAISEGKLSSVKYYCFLNRKTIDASQSETQILLVLSMLCNQFRIFQYIFDYFYFSEFAEKDKNFKSIIFAPIIGMLNLDVKYKSYIKSIPKSFLPFYKYLIEEKGIEPIQEPFSSKRAFLSTIVVAGMQNDVESVRYLIEECHVSFKLDELLSITCATGSLNVVQYLIENNRFDMAKKIKGHNLLHHSCILKEFEIYLKRLPLVKFLVEKCHIDVNSQSDDGNTALHYAKYSGFDDIAKYLISKGADQNIKNKNGKTPNQLEPKKLINEKENCRI